jgi:hypothetical protein
MMIAALSVFVSVAEADVPIIQGEGIQPLIRKIGSDHGSSLGVVRSIVENATAWLLNNKRPLRLPCLQSEQSSA